MKISYVTPEFVTEKIRGGLATYINNVARILADAGNKIYIIVKSDENSVFEYYPNIKVVRTKVCISEFDYEIPGGIYRKNSIKLNECLKKIDAEEDIDIVQYPNWMALGIDRINIPSVVRISSDLPSLRAANKWDYDAEKLYPCEKVTDLLEDISVMKADNVFAPSICVAEIIGKRIGSEINVIESPFYNIGISESADVLKLPNNYLLTFCTLDLIKGIRLIGETIYNILDKRKDLYYVFAGADTKFIKGDGTEVVASEFLKKSAGKYSNRVIYLGMLEWNKLSTVIRNAKICVMPSRIDNLPNSCIEAMAMGKVVLGTKGASFDQLIKEKENGFLMEREDKEGFQQKLDEIFSISDECLLKIGENAKERIKLMAPNITANRLINIYEQTISGKMPMKYDAKYNLDCIKRYNEFVNKKNPKYCL